MIIDIDYMLQDSGFAIDADDKKVSLAIQQGEGVDVAMMLAENYAVLCDLAVDSPYDVRIAGGIYTDERGHRRYIAGAKTAIAHIVFAWLLSNNIASTTFGSVRKKDDYSDNVDPFTLCRQYYTIGRQMLRDLCSVMGWKLHQGVGYYKEVL